MVLLETRKPPNTRTIYDSRNSMVLLEHLFKVEVQNIYDSRNSMVLLETSLVIMHNNHCQ